MKENDGKSRNQRHPLISCKSCGKINKIQPYSKIGFPKCGHCNAYLQRADYSIPKNFSNCCPICDELCNSGTSLTNNVLCHRGCIERPEKHLTEIQNDIHRLLTERRNVIQRIASSKSIFYIVSLFFGREEIDEIELTEQATQLQQEISSLEDYKNTRSDLLTSLYDYWPTYPPDWYERREKAIGESSKCSYCGQSKGKLHVHHKLPISQGGSQLQENLIVLCEKHHLNIHGVREFVGKGKGFEYTPEKVSANPFDLIPTESRIESGRKKASKRKSSPMRVIKTAIKESTFLNFHYTRKDGAQSVRSINPTEVIKIEKVWCVRGYCLLRKDARTFSVKQMKKIVSVTKPGRCYDC